MYKTKSYFLKCRKDTVNINPRVSNKSNGRKTILSKCAICGSKKSRFIKNQEAKKFLSNLGVRTPFSKVTILGDNLVNAHAKLYIKMNEIVNKSLLADDKFMLEKQLIMHIYNAFVPFTKNKERIQNFKETADTSYIYKNEFDKACLLHDMAYGNFKDLARRTASDKV